MSKLVGKQLPGDLAARLGGSDIDAYEGKIIPIVTLDDAGWPHPALLSYYEVRAKDNAAIDLALWKESSTASNLKRSGKVALIISDAGVNYYVKGSVQLSQLEMTGAPQVSRFRMTVEQVLEDQEPNAEITSGLTYRRLTKRDANDFAVKVFRLLGERA